MYVAAFCLAGGCFLALFAFGKAGARWVLGIYVFGLTLACLSGVAAVARHHRLWLAGLKTQPDQGPGFSALELAAINEIANRAGPDGPALHTHLAGSEVAARYNSGAGCVTSVAGVGETPAPLAALHARAWLQVDGLGPVGCQLWADPDGRIDLLEIFTGGVDTAHTDWATATFEMIEDPEPQHPVPTTRPIVTEPRWIRYRPEA